MSTQNTAVKTAGDPITEAIEQMCQDRDNLLAQAQNIDDAITRLRAQYSSRRPVASRFKSVSKQLSSDLAAGGLTPEDVLATLPEARKHVYAHRYGKGRAAGAGTHRSRSPRGK